MFHQLVLHGIGGKTIAEAKANVDWVEAQRWLAYISKRGTLDVGTRLEAGFALLAYLIANKGLDPLKKQDGTRYTIGDFMPHADKSSAEAYDEDGNLTTDAIMRALTGGKK